MLFPFCIIKHHNLKKWCSDRLVLVAEFMIVQWMMILKGFVKLYFSQLEVKTNTVIEK